MNDILKKVRKIEIKTKRLSDHIFSGEYHTSFKGKGMSFSEVRQYQYGDDIRKIDWNVTARYNEPYIKVFEEERELTMMLLVDISASTIFGSSNDFKKDIITEISATLAFSATTNNDKVGVILFSDKIELFIPPKKGKSHILRIIKELIAFKPNGTQTNINVALEYLNQVMKKKTITFIISDFIGDDYENTLKITAKKHDITGIKVFDIREKEMPNIGFVQMVDAETGDNINVDTSNTNVRQAYKTHFLEMDARFKSAFSKAGAGIVSCCTTESYTKKLLSYFKTR